MKSERFYKLLKERVHNIEATLKSKGIEYSTEDNKLHNFDRAAIVSDQIREKALLGMLLKHQVSILDIVDNIDKKNILPSIPLLQEKCGDIINYYILLEACIVDRIEKEESDTNNRVSK